MCYSDITNACYLLSPAQLAFSSLMLDCLFQSANWKAPAKRSSRAINSVKSTLKTNVSETCSVANTKPSQPCWCLTLAGALCDCRVVTHSHIRFVTAAWPSRCLSLFSPVISQPTLPNIIKILCDEGARASLRKVGFNWNLTRPVSREHFMIFVRRKSVKSYVRSASLKFLPAALHLMQCLDPIVQKYSELHWVPDVNTKICGICSMLVYFGAMRPSFVWAS
jgi:hypothetical protein